jgi:hypothetical protein
MAMATNDELLGQIGKLLDTKLEAEQANTSMLIDQKLVPIQKLMKTMNKKLNRVQKDISFLIKSYDSHVIHLRGRIERLEEHTGINKN